MKSNNILKWLLFLSLCLIWGSSFKLMEESATVINPNRLAALRIFSAALFFLPFAIIHIRNIPGNKIGLVALNGTIGNLLPAFLFAFALNDPAITGPIGGILNALTPLCVVTIAILFYKDRIALNKLLGIGIGLVGLVLLTLLPVIRLMIIPTSFLLWQFDFFALPFEDASIQTALWKGAGLGVAGSALATILFYMLLQRAGGLFASLVTYGIPVVAVIVGWIDNIYIDPVQILCLGIILSGVYLVNKKS